MVLPERAERVPGSTRATGLSLTSWVLFATSGPLAGAVMAAGWTATEVTSVRLVAAAALLLAGALLVQLVSP